MRAGIVAGLIAILALTLTGCGGETSADLVDYRPGPGADEITVTYLQRPADSAGHVEVVTEDATQIKVKVLYEAADGPQDDLGVTREAVAELAGPVGDRSIIDEHGEPVPLRK